MDIIEAKIKYMDSYFFLNKMYFFKLSLFVTKLNNSCDFSVNSQFF